jgi:hypothetical protein
MAALSAVLAMSPSVVEMDWRFSMQKPEKAFTLYPQLGSMLVFLLLRGIPLDIGWLIRRLMMGQEVVLGV